MLVQGNLLKSLSPDLEAVGAQQGAADDSIPHARESKDAGDSRFQQEMIQALASLQAGGQTVPQTFPQTFPQTVVQAAAQAGEQSLEQTQSSQLPAGTLSQGKALAGTLVSIPQEKLDPQAGFREAMQSHLKPQLSERASLGAEKIANVNKLGINLKDEMTRAMTPPNAKEVVGVNAVNGRSPVWALRAPLQPELQSRHNEDLPRSGQESTNRDSMLGLLGSEGELETQSTPFMERNPLEPTPFERTLAFQGGQGTGRASGQDALPSHLARSLSGHFQGREAVLTSNGVATNVIPMMQTGQKSKSSSTQSRLSGEEFLTALDSIRKPLSQGSPLQPTVGTSGIETPLGSKNFEKEGFVGMAGEKQIKSKNREDSSGDSRESQFGALFSGVHTDLTAKTASSEFQKPMQMTAQTTPGPQGEDRLNPDSVMNLAKVVSDSRAGNSGRGEIRVWLKPENLGGLNIRIATTEGGRVELQIQASNEKAKKVIEESMGSLKESLAAKNLTLAQVDLSVSQATASSENHDFTQSNSGNSLGRDFGNFQDNLSGNSNHTRQDRRQGDYPDYSGRDTQNTRLKSIHPAWERAGMEAVAAKRWHREGSQEGRIDVRA